MSAPVEAIARDTPRRSPSAAAAKRLRRPALRESTRICLPVSGSTSQSSPRSGSSSSRGSRISIATTSWRPARSSSGVRQSSGPRKSETTATRARCRAIAAVWRSARPSAAGPARSSGSSRILASSPISPTLPWRGGVACGRPSPMVTIPNRFPRLRGDTSDRERNTLRHVGFAPVGGAELHRRRGVENEPGDEHALGKMDAHVRLARAGRDVPVDPAHVVPGRIGADLGELGADPQHGGPVVTGQEPFDPAADGDVEGAEQLLGNRAWARAGRRRFDSVRTSVTRQMNGWPGRMRAPGRSAGQARRRARGSRMSSGFTSSAIAW